MYRLFYDVYVEKPEIAEHIKAVRGGRSREAFALELHVTRQTVFNWETGKTVPPIEMLAALGLEIAAIDRKLERHYEPVEAAD